MCRTVNSAKSSLEEGLKKLRDLVERLALAVEPEALQVRPGKVDKTSRAHGASVNSPNVFIIHGRSAGGFRDSVGRFIEQLDLSPIILADQASEGRTLIEKFEASALDVGYAIAPLTPEDSAYGPDDEPPPRPTRARQNVILELGYFMASLGRKKLSPSGKRVSRCRRTSSASFTSPSMTPAHKTLLARELNAAGYDIDLKKLLG